MVGGAAETVVQVEGDHLDADVVNHAGEHTDDAGDGGAAGRRAHRHPWGLHVGAALAVVKVDGHGRVARITLGIVGDGRDRVQAGGKAGRVPHEGVGSLGGRPFQLHLLVLGLIHPHFHVGDVGAGGAPVGDRDGDNTLNHGAVNRLGDAHGRAIPRRSTRRTGTINQERQREEGEECRDRSQFLHRTASFAGCALCMRDLMLRGGYHAEGRVRRSRRQNGR